MMTVENLPQPLLNKVLVEVFELPVKTPGGLFVPEHAKAAYQGIKGTIISVGSTCKLGMKPGDVVLFEPNSGTRMYFKVGEDAPPKDHLIVVEDAILGILEDVNE